MVLNFIYHSFNLEPIDAVNFNLYIITVLIREGEESQV